MNWISTKDKLPDECKYVLARHSRRNWHDSDDQANVNCVVVKLVKGISKNDRQLMKVTKLPTIKEQGVYDDGSWDNPIFIENERHNVYKSEDEHANNLVPYNWRTFGNDSFFGQTITHWTPIEPIM